MTAPPSPLVLSFLAPLHTHPKKILLLYLLAVLGLSIPASKFTSETDSSFVAPDDSMAAVAGGVYEELYGGDSGVGAIVLITGTGVTKGTTADSIVAYTVDLATTATSLSSSCSLPATSQSYHSLASLDPTQSLLADSFVNEDDTATFIYVTYNCAQSAPTNKFTGDFKEYATKGSPLILNFPPGVEVRVTGVEFFQSDILEGVESDLSSMDRTILPLSLLILSLVLRSLKIMIIPIITIVTTIVFSFGIMYPIALTTQVVSFTSSIMMTLTIAMSIDYSLFLLSRLKEAHAQTRDDDVHAASRVHAALAITLTHAGHTIVASGSTLCLCFAGMLLLPMEMLHSVGIGASVAIVCCLGVNLTLVPTLVYAMGEGLLEVGERERVVCCLGEEGEREATAGEKEDGDAATEPLLTDYSKPSPPPSPSSPSPPPPPADPTEHLMYKSLWYKSGRLLVQPKYGLPVLLLVVGLMTPIARHFPEMETSIGFDLLLPVGADSLVAFDRLGESEFFQAWVFPFLFLFSRSDFF